MLLSMRIKTLKSSKVSVGCQIDPALLQRMDRVIRYNNKIRATDHWNRNKFLTEMIQEYVADFEKDIPIEFELLPLSNKEVIPLKSNGASKEIILKRFRNQPEFPSKELIGHEEKQHL